MGGINLSVFLIDGRIRFGHISSGCTKCAPVVQSIKIPVNKGDSRRAIQGFF